MSNVINPDNLIELVDEYAGMDKLEVKGENIVELCGKSGLPKDIEVQDAFMLRMIESNFRGVDHVRAGAEIIYCSKMPEAPKIFELTSRCKELWLNGADVSGCELMLAEGGDKLYMGHTKGIKPGSDFSGFDYVEMSGNKMKDFNSYKFKDGSSIDMVLCSDFSGTLDLSAFADVDLRSANLSGVDEIIFREGARVDISGAKNLPKVLDLSKCGAVRACNTDVTGVEKFKYRDSEQGNKFINEIDSSTYPVIRIDGTTPSRNMGGGGMDM